MKKLYLYVWAAFVLPLFLVPPVAQAKDVYGFMTGSGNIGELPIGIYRFDTSGGSAELLEAVQFQFWGGASCGGSYYMVLSDDYSGFTPRGFCAYDFSTGTMAILSASQTYQCSDMAYDYSTGTLYGVQIKTQGSDIAHTLITIDTVTGSRTVVATLDRKVAALACDRFGDMYAMDYGSQLYRLDKGSGSLTLVGSTGVATDNTQAQSMEFDRATGELYWSYLTTDEDACFSRLDPSTGAVEETVQLDDNALVVGLHIPFVAAADAAPARPQSLSVTAEGRSVTLTWTNPTQTYGGAELSAPLDKVEIVRNGETVHTVEAPVAGESASWTDLLPDDVQGQVRYVVYAYNEAGRGDCASQTVTIGDEAPGAATDVKAVRDGDGVRLSWTAPATGVDGGTLQAGSLSYRLTRMPDGAEFDGIKETTFTDNTITTGAYYSYSVVCYNSAGESDAALSDTIAAGPSLEIPYIADFTTAICGAQWLIEDANGDGYTWRYSQADGLFKYTTNFFKSADDHLVSVPFRLAGGQTYKLKYSITAPSLIGSKEHFRVSIADAGGNSRVLDELTDFSCSEVEEHGTEFAVDADGDYTFTLSALSEADQWMITISGFSVESVVTCDLALLPVSALDLTAGTPSEIAATVENRGTEAVDAYKLVLADSEGNELAAMQVDTPIAAGAQATSTLQWTPENVGEDVLTLKVVAADDAVEANNTVTVAVNVIGADEKYVELGGKDSRPDMLPFAFDGYTYSFSQAIYRQAEIGCGQGEITELKYPYTNSGSTIADRHVKVYVANTAFERVSEGWLAESDMELAYDGYVTFAEGEGVMTIAFDQPFAYDGGNLCVMCQKLDDVTMGSVRFYAHDYGDEARTALYNGDNAAVVLSQVQGSTMLNSMKMRIRETGNPEGISTVDGGASLSMRLEGRRLVVAGCKDARVSVFDLSGKAVAAGRAGNALDLSRLAVGVYIVRVQAADGQTVTDKVAIH